MLISTLHLLPQLQKPTSVSLSFQYHCVVIPFATYPSLSLPVSMARYSLAFAAWATAGAAAAAGEAAAYSQCGGQGWTGATACVAGYQCQAQNEWYSQCVLGSDAATAAAADPKTTMVTLTGSSARKSANIKLTTLYADETVSSENDVYCLRRGLFRQDEVRRYEHCGLGIRLRHQWNLHYRRIR